MPEKSLKKYLELYAVLLRSKGGGVRKKEFRITKHYFACVIMAAISKISSLNASSCAVALNFVTS